MKVTTQLAESLTEAEGKEVFPHTLVQPIAQRLASAAPLPGQRNTAVMPLVGMLKPGGQWYRDIPWTVIEGVAKKLAMKEYAGPGQSVSLALALARISMIWQDVYHKWQSGA